MLPVNLFPWLKLAGVLAIVIALAAAWAYWRQVSAEAALVPQLSQRIASDDARASALATRLAQVEKARAAAEAAFGTWQAGKTLALQSLEKEGQHAPAATNPVCAPTAADRSLRNQALGRLTRFDEAGGAAQLPAGAGAAR